MLEMLKRILGRRSNRHASAKEVILYTREGCHLCEDADQLLRKYGLSPKLIDIDEDEHLVQVRLLAEGRSRIGQLPLLDERREAVEAD